MSYETEVATTKIAKRLAFESGQPEAMWQLFLTAAYREYYNLPFKASDASKEMKDG